MSDRKPAGKREKAVQGAVRRRGGAAGVILCLPLLSGCALLSGPAPPPTEQCYVAIRSYSALLKGAHAWYLEHPASATEKSSIKAAITGARPFRATCESLAVQCETWAAAAERSVADCPQGEKLRAAAGNLDAFVTAGRGVMAEVRDDE